MCGRSGNGVESWKSCLSRRLSVLGLSNLALDGHDSREIAAQRMIRCEAAEPVIDLLQAPARCPGSR
jgi:hypothetical protein